MAFINQIQSYHPENEQERSDQRVMLHYIQQFEHNILHRENEIAHITSSSIILNTERTKMLMIHHNIYNTWTWTGGHADGDRDLLAIALKEAREETGIVNIRPLSLEIGSIDILPVWGHVKRGKYVSAHLHLNAAYIFLADEAETLNIKPDENSDIRWILLEEVAAHSKEPDIILVYNKLLEKAKRY
jgi:8-oxo-dGTP pyrophosphatase MutT (NUDIX family)